MFKNELVYKITWWCNSKTYIMEITKLELFGALSTMVAVISALWVLLNAYIKRDKERLEKYEAAHNESHKQIIELTGDHRELKGRIDGIEALSTKVLNKIEEVNKES